MPIYEYQCSKCEKRFEELILDRKPALVHCPECGTNEVNRLLSLFATSMSSLNSFSDMNSGSASAAHACGCGHCTCGHG